MTLKDFNEFIELIYRVRPRPKAPTQTVDLEMLVQHNIPHYVEYFNGEPTVMFSSTSIKQARSIGAIKPRQ
jgi:hypothetical protein